MTPHARILTEEEIDALVAGASGLIAPLMYNAGSVVDWNRERGTYTLEWMGGRSEHAREDADHRDGVGRLLAAALDLAATARKHMREADGLRRQNERLRRANSVRDDRTSDAFEYGASLMRSRCAELLGELAALAQGEAAAALANARAHLGALPTADPPQCHEEGWDALRRDIAAGGPDDTLNVRVRRLAEAVGKAEASKEFTASWYSTRWERLRVLLQPTDLWRSACAIMANGTADMGEPPTYAQDLNVALHRAKEAEKRAARAERELAENLPLYKLPPEQRAFFEAQRRVSDLSEAAGRALAEGKRRDAAALYEAATVLELRVLATVPPEKARTRAIIAKSAEALAHKARTSRRARSRIHR